MPIILETPDTTSTSSTITLQQTVDWARTFTRLIPIVGVGGFTNEPALTICNRVIQEILAPSFNWKFNRKSAPAFDTVNEQQEYTLAGVTDIGWLERCIAEHKESSAVVKPKIEIECVYSLPKTHIIDNPQKIALDRESGPDSFVRLWPVPGTTIWTVQLEYQAKPPRKTSLTSTWAPIPDDLSYVYEQGFLAMALQHADDARAEQEYRKFQLLILRALQSKDTEQRNERFIPTRSIMIG